MDHPDSWFSAITANCELPDDASTELRDNGFVVVPGPVAPAKLAQLAAAYDAAVSGADPADVSIGRSTTRVHDFVNRGPEFDELYIYQPILAACCRVIGRPFRLSMMAGRTLNPNSPAQGLHVDFPPVADGWPMVGFIIMIDEFRNENGATRFLPRSHLWPQVPGDLIQDQTLNYEGEVPACGPAGSVIIYNGSVWHGPGANVTSQPRRSIQGAYIRREVQGWLDSAARNQGARLRPETMSRIGDLAKYVLAAVPAVGIN